MNTTERAEAIIVVGPYLWKCVNCNLLVSRQHSIDDHLLTQHKSSLKPGKPTNNKCDLSVCECQKMSEVSVKIKSKGKRKCYHYNTNSRHFNTGSPLPNSDKTDLSPDCHDLCKTLKLETNSMNTDFQEKDDEDCVKNLLAEERLNPIEAEEGNANCENETKEEKNDGEDDCENDSQAEKQSTNERIFGIIHQEEKTSVNEERGVKHVIADPEGIGTRKSRRSNKGKNSYYQEFEMERS